MLWGDVLDEVRALKALPGDMDIVVTGSMRLVASLVPSGLVDDLDRGHRRRVLAWFIDPGNNVLGINQDQ